MAINKSRIKNTLTEVIKASITDSMIEEAIIDNLRYLDMSDTIRDVLDNHVEYVLEDYVKDMMEDCVRDAVSDVLSDVFE